MRLELRLNLENIGLKKHIYKGLMHGLEKYTHIFSRLGVAGAVLKLDGVGHVDNRPSTAEAPP